MTTTKTTFTTTTYNSRLTGPWGPSRLTRRELFDQKFKIFKKIFFDRFYVGGLNVKKNHSKKIIKLLNFGIKNIVSTYYFYKLLK